MTHIEPPHDPGQCPDETTHRNNLAARLFQVAINRGQAGDLLDCLFNGGSATINPQGEIVMVTAEMLAEMGFTQCEEEEEFDPDDKGQDVYAYTVGQGGNQRTYMAPTAYDLARICPAFTEADRDRLLDEDDAFDAAVVSDRAEFTPSDGQSPIGFIKHIGGGEIIWKQAGHPSSDPDAPWRPVYLVIVP